MEKIDPTKDDAHDFEQPMTDSKFNPQETPPENDGNESDFFEEDGDESDFENDDANIVSSNGLDFEDYIKKDVSDIKAGIVQVNVLKEAHEVIYGDDTLFKELVDDLKYNLPASVAHNLAEEYLKLTKTNVDFLDREQDKNPFMKQQNVNPVIYNYLTNIGVKGKLPYFNQNWLIPIVIDVKRHYNAADSQGEKGSKMTETSLQDSVKKRNELFTRSLKSTDYRTNNTYFSLRHGYVPSTDADEGSIDLTTQFKNPDPDRQDYTIHVLRYHTINGRFEVRKAYGEVNKVKNVYTSPKDAKLTKPIIDTEHILSVSGEVVNVVGFFRIPAKVRDIQHYLSLIYRKKVKVDIIGDDVPNLTRARLDQPAIILFPKHSQDIKVVENLLMETIPNLDNFLRLHEKELNNLESLDYVDKIMNKYGLNIKELKSNDRDSLVKLLRTHTRKLVTNARGRAKRIRELIKEKQGITNDSKIDTIKDHLITNQTIIKHYGDYYDFGTAKDSDVNRLLWITNQLDSGQLFYAILNYVETSNFYLNMTRSDQSNLDMKNLNHVHFEKHLNGIEKEIKILDEQIELAKMAPGASDKALVRANELTKKSANGPLTIVDSQSGQIEKDLSNVFIWSEQRNGYLPKAELSKNLGIIALETQKSHFEDIKSKINNIKSIADEAKQDVVKSITKLKLLESLYITNNKRAEIKTSLNRENLELPEQNILDLLKNVRSANLVDSQNLYKRLIQTYGILDSSGNWYVSKTSGARICCTHLWAQLNDKSLDTYTCDGPYCKICHEQIGEIDFDTFGGYDSNDAPIRLQEGNVYESHLQDLANEKVDSIIQNQPSGELNCQIYSNNEFKRYACYVLTYLKRHNQGLLMNNSQIVDSIKLFGEIIKLSDLKTNINLDPSNQHIRNEMFNRFTKKMLGGKKLKKVQEKKVKVLSDISLAISKTLDRYILSLISGVITLELDKPENYLMSGDNRLLNDLINEQLAEIEIEIDGKKSKQPQFIYNLSKIIIKPKQSPEIPETPKLLMVVYMSNQKLAYIGNEEDVNAREYFEKKMKMFYDIIRKQASIRKEYERVQEELEELIKAKEDQKIDPESLLQFADNVKDFSYKNPEEYYSLINRINLRKKYLIKLRNIRFYKLNKLALNLINSDNRIMHRIIEMPVTADCPVNARQFYLDYLTSIPDLAEEKYKKDNPDYIISSYTKTPALVVKEYNMSGKQDVFNELKHLEKNVDLVKAKQNLIDMYHEIQSLEHELTKLFEVFREEIYRPVNPFKKTTHRTVVTKMYNPSKSTKWFQLPNKVDLPDPATKGLPEKSELNTKLNKSRTYLINLINQHLQSNSLWKDKRETYIELLNNLGKTDKKESEAKYTYEQFQNKYNHKWSQDIVNHMYLKKVFGQKVVRGIEIIRGYIYLFRYLVAVLQNNHKVTPVEEVNDETYNLIDEFKEDKSGALSDWTYKIPNSQVDHLVGVFNRQNSHSLDDSKYLAPDQVAEMVNYVFTQDLVSHFQKIYELEDNVMPTTITDQGTAYSLFIVQFLRILDRMRAINDTTNKEVSDLWTAYVSKKYRRYQSIMKNMNKSEKMIWREQLRNKLVAREDMIDPTEADITSKVKHTVELTQQEQKDMELNVAIDPAGGDFNGENEYENPDDFGDDVNYG